MRKIWLMMGATMLATVHVETAQALASSDPTYIYRLEASHDKTLCGHMRGVLNRNFSDFWVGDQGGLVLDAEIDGTYSAQSRFAWPTFPGVEHNYRTTFDMRYSKFPSSAEFDVIDWREGRQPINGAAGFYWRPFLAANIDIDNDSHVDTVVKMGFSQGYANMTAVPNPEPEGMVVWRSVRTDFQRPFLLERLDQKQGISVSGGRLRPFRYRGRYYVASYRMDLGQDFMAAKRPPFRPMKESMEIHSYHVSGRNTLQSRWNTEMVCRFAMRQQ
jgi:hypothetical protein